MSHSEALTQLIIERIDRCVNRHITFADYMDLLLYHPEYGYYSSGKVNFGSDGDYFTSSSLGCYFAELLAEQLFDTWQILGHPHLYSFVEMGAGSGIFARDLLDYLIVHYPEFVERLNYVIIEVSPSLIDLQQDTLQDCLKRGINLSWKTWQDISDSSVVGCFFSNEFFDALPVHKVVVNNQQLQEVYVTHADNIFQEVQAEISTDSLLQYFELVDIDILSGAYPDGYQTEVNLSVLSCLQAIAKKLKRGYVITIDYGYPAHKYYHPQRSQGTLKCYYQHRHHDNPFVNLGCQDITTHLDFTALEKQGQLWGLDKLGFTSQALFLMALGLGDRLTELSTGKFNVMEMMQRRDYLHQLIEPDGLGGFGVLIQCLGLTDEEKMHAIKGLKINN